MVNRQQQRGNSRRERKRVNTRCLGCGYGCGQFGVEYCTDEDNGSGRGYCSLDCYTSAKVTGRNLQTRAEGGGEAYCNQRYRGSSGRMYGQPQPQPWPTGLLVEAPPAPQPWRGRTRTISQGSMSWRTAGSSSTGNLSSADDSSSQESSVAEWHMGESEDGGTSVGSGGGAVEVNGISSGGASGLPAPEPAPGHVAVDIQSNYRFERDGGGGGPFPRNNGAGGHTNSNDSGYASGTGGRGGGCHPFRHGQTSNDRVDATSRAAPAAGAGTGSGGNHRTHARGGVITAGGNTTRGENLPPLAPVPVAPIPRLGAFPAQRRVHGPAGGGCGGRRVNVRTVAFANPPAQTVQPSPQPPSASEGGAAVDKEPLPLPPPRGVAAGAADAPTEEQPQRPEAAMLAVGAGATVAPPGDRRTEGDAGVDGPNSESAPDVVGNGAVAMEDRSKSDQAGATEAAVAAPEGARRGGSGGLTVCGAAAAAAATGTGESAKSLSLEQHVPNSCGPMINLPAKVAITQWRRLFFP